MILIHRLGPLLLAGILVSGQALAAPDQPGHPQQSSSIGLELRAYPAGFIPALRLSQNAGDLDLLLTLGYNDTDRRDWGEHQDETGGGWGLGAGARVRFAEHGSGWIVGARADLWFMEIDWTDPEDQDSTDITVLMPTLEGGYQWIVGEGRWLLEATLSAGAEINLKTQGEEVGEGAIVLIGVAGAYRF